MAFSAILDPVLSPLLNLSPVVGIILISFLLSLVMTLSYKFFTDQDLMKRLKSEIKEFQAEMKTLRDNPSKMMEVQKRAMETNMKYMMQSLRPTLFTFIPLIIIFTWLHGHMGYYPLVGGEEFSAVLEFEDPTTGVVVLTAPEAVEVVNGVEQEVLDNQARFVMKGEPGEYLLSYEFKDQTHEQDLIITSSQKDRAYAEVETQVKNSQLQKITLSNTRIRPLKSLPIIGSIPWIGNFGWLGTYILFSIIFSMSLRKLLKIY